MWLIDVDELKQYLATIRKYNNGQYNESYLIDVLDQQPIVDAVEVVRCKDCIFNRAKDWVNCFNNGMFGRTTDNFCSRGEKRKNDT